MKDQSGHLLKGFFEKTSSRIEKWLDSDIRGVPTSALAVLVMVLAYFLIFSVFTVLRQQTFRTFAFDLGIYDQAFFTTLFKGRFFYETPDLAYTLSGSFFGVHFAPNTFFVLPFYYIFPHPETLLVLQSMIIALAAVPIYYLALVLTQRKMVATGFAALYLLNPFIHSLNTYDFHIECLIPLFSMLALYFFEMKQWNRFVVFSVLVGTTIDFGAIIVFFMGLYGLLRYPNSFLRLIRRKETVEKEKLKAIMASLVVLASAVGLLAIAIKVLMLFGPMPLSPSYSGALFPKLGNNFVEILSYMITQPWRLIDSVLYDAPLKFSWLLLLFLSTLFLAFFSIRELILCAPWIIVTLLTTNSVIYQAAGTQFGAFIIPFIFFASIHGIRNIQKRNRQKKLSIFGSMKNVFAVALVLLLLISPISPVPYCFIHRDVYSGYPIPTQHTHLLTEALGLIPANSSVLAQDVIFPHVSERVNAYVWIPQHITVEYAIADKTRQDYFIVSGGNQSFKDQFEALQKSGKYQVIYNNDGIIVLRRLPGQL